MVTGGAFSESYERSENCLPQLPCVVTGTEERHLGVVSGWEVVGITHAEFPKVRHQGAARVIGIREPLVAQHLPVLPDELFAGRGAIQLREVSCSGAGRQAEVLGDGPDEADRQVLPLKLVTRQR
jgi:hypothetical protein